MDNKKQVGIDQQKFVGRSQDKMTKKPHILDSNPNLEQKNNDDKGFKRFRKDGKNKKNLPNSEYNDSLLLVRRISRATRGGRSMRFSTLIGVGNGKGSVGLGIAKAKEIPEAIKKAKSDGIKNLVQFPLTNTNTIPHPIIGKYGASIIIMKPAKEGTGIKAGGSARDIFVLAGIKNIRAKSLGSRNKINLGLAVLNGLSRLRKPEFLLNTINTNDLDKKVAPTISNPVVADKK